MLNSTSVRMPEICRQKWCFVDTTLEGIHEILIDSLRELSQTEPGPIKTSLEATIYLQSLHSVYKTSSDI